MDQVIAGLKAMKLSLDDAREQINKAIGCLSKRRDKTTCGALNRGGIEISNKFICNGRLKRSGAWWYPTNANNTLKLRCAKYNGTYGRIMTEAMKNEQADWFS